MNPVSDTFIKTRLEQLPRILSAAVILIGCLVLTGWILDIPVLRSGWPGLEGMKANAALAFVLCGLSLWLQNGDDHRWTSAGKALAALAAILGLITTFEYVSGLNMGIDQLLIKDLAASTAIHPAGRMVPLAALGVAIMGSALMLLDSRTRLAQLLALTGGTFGLLGATTFAYYGSKATFGFLTYTQMPIYTAVTFILLSAGILSSRPTAGMIATFTSDGPGGVILRRLLLPLGGLLVLIGGLRHLGEGSGLIEPAFSEAFGLIASLAVLTAMLWWNATSLDRVDLKRKEAEDNLRESEERYRTVANYPYDWEFWQALDGKILYMSPSCERITGYRAGEFMENPGLLDAIVHPDDHHMFKQHKSLALKDKGKPRAHEADFRILRRDGEVRWIGHVCQIIHGADGMNLGLRATNRDITERKRVEEALTLRNRIAAIFAKVSDDEMFNEVLKVILNVMHSPFGVFGFIDEAGALVVPTMTRQIWDKCQVPDKTIVFPCATWGDSSWQRAFREKQANYSNAVSTKTPAGHVTLTRHISLPILYQGEVIGLFQVANKETDYTAADLGTLENIAGQVAPLLSARLRRERAANQLKNSEELFRTASISMTDIVYEWDLKETLVWYGNIDGILGYPPQGFPRTLGGWAATLHPEDTERVWKAVEGQLKGATPYAVEYRIRNKNGEWRWWSARGTALRDERGEPYKWIGAISDITERKRAEEEIQKLNAKLEERVIIRTAQLEAANKELETFSYSVSHDLRSPLRAVDGFSRILLEEHLAELSPDAQHYLNLVRSNAVQMSQLIDDLLAFSRTSRQALAKRSVDPAEIVRQVLEELQSELVGRKAEVIIGDLPECAADPAMLKRVIFNLISNAVKFTQKKEVTQLEIGSINNEGMTTYFVKDNGVGFDMRYSNKLFGVFQRLHSGSDYEGTGVGLAMVQRIIQKHGGRVWAEAEVDKGATFYFTLEGGESR